MKLIVQSFLRFLLLLVFSSAGLWASASVAQTNHIKGVRIWPSPDNTRIVLDLSEKPDYKIHYLKNPDRLLIDLKSTLSIVNVSSLKKNGPLVKRLRKSDSGEKGTYRIVVDLEKETKARVFTLAPEKPYGHRLVLDLPHSETKPKAITPAPTPVQNKVTAYPVGRDIIIAIDAGHGGEDPGALGKYSYEKNITLDLAKRLQKRINKQPGMSAFLVRTGDYFINLNQRSAIARKKKADFLVSIHADGFTSSKPRGASVWVLSNRRATSELGRWMEKHEAHSELLGGAGDLIQDSSSVPFLTEMFLDMSMGNAMDVGYHAGNLVVQELKKVTMMHKPRPVHASLAVLKSPDIPSILVEAGFITNPTEERLLNQAEHQDKIANAVFTGIYKHFVDAPPQHTLFAQKKRSIKHIVRKGESLSVLAARYSVSMKELLSYNNLHSNGLRIGQIIKIPPNYQLAVEGTPLLASAKQQTVATHHVKRGESLSVIAQQYGKSLQEIKRYNNLSSTTISVGQKINIPGQAVVVVQPVTVAPPVQTTQVIDYKVKAGDSLSVIASRYGKSTSELKEYNKLKSTSVWVGQKLKIPGQKVDVVDTVHAKPAPVQFQTVAYQVKPGDSLSVIASRYGKTTSELKEYNKLKSTSVWVGQKLKIPGQQVDAIESVKATPTLAPQKTITYKVKPGESLSVIASRYGKSTGELKDYNKLKSTSLWVGQKLKIPGQQRDVVETASVKSMPTPAPLKNSTYRVKPGESLSVIASRYGKSTSELKDYNKLKSTSLWVGQKLKIPGDHIDVADATKVKPASAPLETITYTVKPGESLSVIASRYGKSTGELKDYNKLKSTSLWVGQKLKIPGDNINVVKTAKVEPAPLKTITYTVKPGESLSVIASRYGKGTSELKDYNKLKSTSLWVGQKLKIPGQKVESVAPIVALLETVTHTVKSGESLSVIASHYGKGTNELKAFNNLKSTSLKVGQKLKIPGQHSNVSKIVKVSAPKNVVHRVKSGESLSVIANQYGRSTSELKAYNNLKTSAIKVGQRIKIPDANYRLPVAVAKPKIVSHKVKSGESLSVIANRYGTTSTVLKAYNNLSSSVLRVNQTIKVPMTSTQFTKHKVRSGESLSVIASRYGTTTRLLKAFNQLSSNSLSVGQVLTVPTT